MKIVSFKRCAYERQIHEAVLINQSKNHRLLNSNGKYNRCSLPRLIVKIGNSELNELAEKMKEEQKSEDDLESRIKEMTKLSKKR